MDEKTVVFVSMSPYTFVMNVFVVFVLQMIRQLII